MSLGVFGIKLGMSRVFLKDGTAVPVTAIKVPEHRVVAIRTVERDGYNAVQVGAFETKEKKLTKQEVGHLKKAGVVLLKNLKEFRVDNPQDYQVGQKITVSDLFKPGDLVDVIGTSKGRGFSGTMKRWDFGGFPRSHGHRYHRAVGSIGQRTDPGRVWKGKRMAGHWGAEKIRVQSLLVVDVLQDMGIILVKGSVPGHPKGTLVIEKSKIANRKSQRLKINRIKNIPENIVRSGT